MGGALFVKTGVVQIVNCTFTQNSTLGGRDKGGIGEAGSGLAGGIFNYQGSVTLKNSIIADNHAETRNLDLEGAFQSNGHNLISEIGAATGLTESSAQKTFLLPLADNGGLTPTHALDSHSAAIGTATFETPLDQRGVTRPPAPDIGAWQSESQLRIIAVAIENNQLKLTIQIPPGRSATLESTSALGKPWQFVSLLGFAPTVSFTLPLNSSAQFFRVK